MDSKERGTEAMREKLRKIKEDKLMGTLVMCLCGAIGICFFGLALATFIVAILVNPWWFVATPVCAIVCAICLGIGMYLED